MDRILIIMKKNNGHQGIICPFTGAFFHNMQTCLLVYTYNRSQVSVYRTIGPLVCIVTQIHFVQNILYKKCLVQTHIKTKAVLLSCNFVFANRDLDFLIQHGLR